jgi:mRNA interferase RelE/StbE
MNWTVFTRKSFLKDLASLPAKVRGRVEAFVFDVLPAADDPFQLGKLEKLEGHQDYYKVRFGSYRLGYKWMAVVNKFTCSVYCIVGISTGIFRR